MWVTSRVSAMNLAAIMPSHGRGGRLPPVGRTISSVAGNRPSAPDSRGSERCQRTRSALKRWVYRVAGRNLSTVLCLVYREERFLFTSMSLRHHVAEVDGFPADTFVDALIGVGPEPVSQIPAFGAAYIVEIR